MKTYIGVKIIRAVPMAKEEAVELGLARRGDLENGQTAEPDAGYQLLYPDGYQSWSPKAVFDAAYREVSDDEARLVQIVGPKNP